jgi:hypothetical protein
MVITLLYLLKCSAGQWNTLVNFGAALLALSGQFSVGVNTCQQIVALVALLGLLRALKYKFGHIRSVPPIRFGGCRDVP